MYCTDSKSVPHFLIAYSSKKIACTPFFFHWHWKSCAPYLWSHNLHKCQLFRLCLLYIQRLNGVNACLEVYENIFITFCILLIVKQFRSIKDPKASVPCPLLSDYYLSQLTLLWCNESFGVLPLVCIVKFNIVTFMRVRELSSDQYSFYGHWQQCSGGRAATFTVQISLHSLDQSRAKSFDGFVTG